MSALRMFVLTIVGSMCLQNVLEYTGSKADRQVIRKHEFQYADARTKALKFDVLLVCSHSMTCSWHPSVFI